MGELEDRCCGLNESFYAYMARLTYVTLKDKGASVLSIFAIFTMNTDHHTSVQLKQLLAIMEMVKMN